MAQIHIVYHMHLLASPHIYYIKSSNMSVCLSARISPNPLDLDLEILYA